MKTYGIVASAALLLIGPLRSHAFVAGGNQSQNADPAQPAQSSSSAPVSATPAAQSKNSYLLVELSKTLKAKKLKPGDKIKAEVSQDVVSHGKIIIPAETELVGHVTEVSVRDAAHPQARLGFVFDRILLKHYRDINFQAVVQTVEAPAPRPSRVDQPSQMLPPSMMVGMRDSGPSPVGRPTGGSATRGASGPGPSTQTASAANPNVAYQAPLTVKQSPSTNLDAGSPGAQLETTPGGKPMSIGMPQGVRGIKGLNLTRDATSLTPGPVIFSDTDDIKLESGTQLLLRIVSIETPR